MIGLLLSMAFTWHLVDDYSNTHRMGEDEERRKRAGLVWQDLTAEKRCLSYEKRMYQAKVMNIPYGEDAQSWCMKTAIDIHEVTYDHPDFCTKDRQVRLFYSSKVIVGAE